MAKASKHGAAKRLYGKTKVGVVGKGPTRPPATPPSDPDYGTDYAVCDDVAERTLPHVVRSKGRILSADGTNLPVAHPISGIREYDRVVSLDNVLQIRNIQLAFV